MSAGHRSDAAVSKAAIEAPGKIVLSGAYSVLWGAPSLVAAVDRYAVADPTRPPVHVGEEVRAAIDLGIIGKACFVDVSGLRASSASGESRKLGLGSSAAIVVATIAALRFADPVAPGGEIDRDAVFADAFRAHRAAQPSGSGVDVAASTYGGVLMARLEEDRSLRCQARPLPGGARVEVFSSKTAAVTGSMIGLVKKLEASEPILFRSIIGRAREGAEEVVAASSVRELLDALRKQEAALRDLARASQAPIFTPEFDELGQIAAREGAFFGPSGAGGGDVGIFVGEADPSDTFATALGSVGVDRLPVRVGAEGVRVALFAPRSG